MSITAHLLSTSDNSSYANATKNHPFLLAAADGTLSDTLLSLWLSQDHIYAAQAYPRFVGSLISHIPFRPSALSSSASPDHSQRTLKILVFALANIVREVEFFNNTAKEWQLDLKGWRERKGTRDYTAEMSRISGSGKIEEGLLFLWAMEKVYLDAWSNVNEKISAREGTSAVRAFATNWSTPEFKAFVDDLALLVDDVYRDLGSDEWIMAEEIWRRVIELEEDFWPGAEEEAQLKV
ncbi:putative TENA/THI-4/PQQC family protein [Lyophyllum shimeji]|uniref:TENA/THI-4/PQQC family protein n=1 Tax=Lyophyllum shimeji TaxID=47721 RepID=A0A9P3PSQ4_LYOSH|nr:putative TENA/THI-4/PQQC family protein [Lyophyllum shimeji]